MEVKTSPSEVTFHDVEQQLEKMSDGSSEGPRGEILQALQLACSQNPEELKIGEEKLTTWKREKGFYRELTVMDHPLEFTELLKLLACSLIMP